MTTPKRFCATFLFILVCATLIVAGNSQSLFAADSPEKPNFILCMTDDQGWGDVGYYGNPVPITPVLDEMAASALRLDRFYAAAPVCSPTRGSVLTGRHPNRFGCFKWGNTLRPQEMTIAEALKTAGYTSGHFGKWHLGSVRAGSPVSPGNSGFDEWASSPNFYENSPLLSHNGKVIETDGESSMVTMDLALDFIRKASKEKTPFLAVIWFGNPHSPHQALPELRELYPDLPPNLQNYYGEITGVDRAMGHLRKQLREMGIAENTLLWFTSDNGPQGGGRGLGSAGGLSGRKGSLWEGGIRVPTIIEWPARIPKQRISDIPGNTVDIYPTLLDIAGVKMPHQPVLDGISLLPVINGTATTREKPMGFWDYASSGIPRRSHDLLAELKKEQEAGEETDKDLDPKAADTSKQYPLDDRAGSAALIDGNYKILRLAGKDSGTMLFDLASDQEEKVDLSEKEPERFEKMKAALEAWQISVLRSLNGDDYHGGSK